MEFKDKILFILLPLPFTTLGLNYFTFSNVYVPEVFIILWFLLFLTLKPNSTFIVKNIALSKLTASVVFFLLGLSILSAFHDEFNFTSFYGRFRALFFSIIGFLSVYILTKNYRVDLKDGLILITFSAGIMYLLNILLNNGGDLTKFGVSMICYSIGVCLLLEKKKYSIALILSLIAGLAAFFSFFRQNYFIAFYLILYVSIFLFNSTFFSKKNILLLNKKVLSSYFILCGTFTLIILNFSFFQNYLYATESSYIQSIGKMNDLIYSFGKSSELDESGALRLQSFQYLINNLPYYILPNGLVDDSLLMAKSLWGGETSFLEMSIVRDSIFGYFIIVFGFLISFILFFIFMYNLFLFYYRNFKLSLFRCMVILPSFIMVLFLDGATLTQIQKSLFFGIGLAVLICPLENK